MKNCLGFNLIELLLILGMIAIISAIAYPSYTQYVTRTHRSEGQRALLDLAARLENYYGENHTYQNANSNVLGIINPVGLYNLMIASTTNTNYLIEAQPIGQQAINDQQCATLKFYSDGTKGQSGFGTVNDCW